MSETAARTANPTPACTETEMAVVQATAEVWNAFLRLPNLNRDDVDDVRFHVHALQSIAAANFVARTFPGFFDLPTLVKEAAPRAAAGSSDGGRLTDEEQRDQATRCSCRGSDDLCPCQNVPDRQTRSARADAGMVKVTSDIEGDRDGMWARRFAAARAFLAYHRPSAVDESYGALATWLRCSDGQALIVALDAAAALSVATPEAR